MFLAGSAGRKSNICELGCRSLNGRCQVLDVKVTSANAAILTRNLKSGALFIAHHHHVPDRQIKRDQLRVCSRMYVKVKKMGGEGGGDAIIMISKTATIEELKTKVKER